MAYHDLPDDVKVVAGKLMTELCTRTTAKAKRALMQMPESESSNGFKAWRILAYIGEGGGSTRKTGILNMVLKLNSSGNDFLDKVGQWETLVRQYEKTLDAGRKLDDDVKIATVTGGSHGKLREQLIAKTSTFDDYDDMKRFSMEYHNNQRVFIPPSQRGGKGR